jgi:5-formyltetrahydrofolate cyclo-ligase
MKKTDLRKLQLKRLKTLPLEQKQEQDRYLLQEFLQLPDLAERQQIGLTVSLPFEVDTAPLIVALIKAGHQVFLAKTRPGRQMDFVRYQENTTLVKSKFGVTEPASGLVNNDLDLLVVPGLAFNLTNHQRLGFGGGYYDRFLAQHPQTKTISLVNQIMATPPDDWPLAQTDRPVAELILAR